MPLIDATYPQVSDKCMIAGGSTLLLYSLSIGLVEIAKYCTRLSS